VTYRIFPLNTGNLSTGLEPGPGGSSPKARIPALAFLLSDGRNHLLVDTGMPTTGEALTHRPDSEQPKGWDILKRLWDLHLVPGQLSALILTHLHWDHTANMEGFSGVPKLVQDREAAFVSSLPEEFEFSFEYASSILRDPDLRLVRGRFDYDPFVSLIPTPGHTPGHQSVVVKTGAGTYILAGDATWPGGERGLLPPRKAVDADQARRSFRALTERGEPLLASHDPDVVSRGLKAGITHGSSSGRSHDGD
jgi:N-acyl homoserine lactone hydrolase